LGFRYVLQVHHDSAKRDATVEERLTSGGDILYSFGQSEVRLFGDAPSMAPKAVFPADPRRSFLPILEPGPDNQRITAFKRWLAGMWLFKLRPDLIGSESNDEATALAPNGSNFVSWFRTLLQEAPATVHNLVSDARAFIPGLSDIRLDRVGSEVKRLMLDCKVGPSEFRLSMADLSDGQRILLVLYTILHQIASTASLLVFDEPDNFVADSEIQPWISAVRERIAEARRGTLLVFSHHPHLIDYLAADQVLRLWRDDGPTRVEELSVDRDQGLPVSTLLNLGIAGA
jgi:hypothetical protein